MKIEEIREKASTSIEKLDNPESIRTPGRTWTRYPELDIEEVEDIDPEIKTDGAVEVFTGQEAVDKAGDKLFNLIKMDEDRLNALHAANINAIIYVKAEGESDIEILYDKDSPVFAHLVVETMESAEVTVKEEFRGDPEIQTSINEFYVGDNSTLEYGAIESTDSGFSYTRRKALAGRDSTVNWLNSMFGADMNRTEIETVLKGDNSSTEKTGVWYPTGEQHIDISLKVYHRGENTRCSMDSRAVADDRARSIYEGLQHVGDEADDTKSFQDEKVMMLSDEAEADASPKLMINDPDVKASHAASAGNIPEKELHYMQSRGIGEEEARKLVVKGYFEPVMKEISLPGFKDKIREEVARKLGN